MTCCKNALTLLLLAIGMTRSGVKWETVSVREYRPVAAELLPKTFTLSIKNLVKNITSGGETKTTQGIKDFLGHRSDNKETLQYIGPNKQPTTEESIEFIAQAGFINPNTSTSDRLSQYGLDKGTNLTISIRGGSLDLSDSDMIYLVNMLIMAVKGDYTEPPKYPPLVKRQKDRHGFSDKAFIIDVQNIGEEYYFTMMHISLGKNTLALENLQQDKQELFLTQHPGLFKSSNQNELVQVLVKENSYYRLLSDGSKSESDLAESQKELLQNFRLTRDSVGQNSDYILLCHDLHGKIEIELSTQEMSEVLKLVKDYKYDTSSTDAPRIYTKTIDTANGKTRHTFAFNGTEIRILSANLGRRS